MTTILKCSILSIFKFEKLQLHPVCKKLVRNDVRYRVEKREFTILPAPKQLKHQVLPSITSTERVVIAPDAKKSQNTLTSLLSFYALITFAIFLLAVIVKLTFPYPFHASCLIKWDFGEPCVHVVQRLRSQILKWSCYEDCGTKCFYTFDRFVATYENNTIQATRISPKYNTPDEITIIFTDSDKHTCTALAESTTKSWLSLFDDGRNYCNLHDLIVGAQYDDNRDFAESTNNFMCTQYEMAYCD